MEKEAKSEYTTIAIRKSDYKLLDEILDACDLKIATFIHSLVEELGKAWNEAKKKALFGLANRYGLLMAYSPIKDVVIIKIQGLTVGYIPEDVEIDEILRRHARKIKLWDKTRIKSIEKKKQELIERALKKKRLKG